MPAILSEAAAKGIHLSGIRSVSDTEIELTIEYEDLKAFRKMARNKYRLKVLSVKGLNHIAAEFFQNKLRMVGIIIFIVVFLFQSLFIREVDVQGNVTVSETDIRACIRKAGIYEGARKGFDHKKAENMLFRRFDRVVWADVSGKGGYVLVQVAEGEGPLPANSRKDRPCHIVADMSCYIEKVVARKGRAVVKPGQYVKKGAILISGTIPIKKSTYDEENPETKVFVHSSGTVTVRAPYYYSIVLGKNYRKAQVQNHVASWIAKNIPKKAQILNKSLNFTVKENIIRVYGIIETRQRIGVEQEINIDKRKPGHEKDKHR